MALKMRRTDSGQRVFVVVQEPSSNGDEQTDPLAVIDDEIESAERNSLAEERATLGNEPLVDSQYDTWAAYDGRPTILKDRNDGDVANSLVALIKKRNDPPRAFTYGDAVTCVQRLPTGDLAFGPVDRDGLRNHLEWAARLMRRTRTGLAPASYTPAVLDLTLQRLQSVLPHVDFITESAYVRTDGSICTTAGCDPIGGAFVARTPDCLAVPDNPNDSEVAAAIALIDEFMQDFPFVDDSDRATVFALLLTITGRPLFSLVPMFLVSGNGPGVGKNLLAECCVRITTGGWPGTFPLPPDSEEQRKALTAKFREGRPVVILDEVHILSGTSIARALTSYVWEDRLLGYSKTVNYPNKRTMIALGNNTSVQGDLPRRVTLCRLHSDLEAPYLRHTFKHGNLRSWVVEHEERLLTAVLTLWRYWFVTGQPKKSGTRLGSFEDWAATIGGLLDLIGVNGLLGNSDALHQEHADDDNEMREHLRDLWRRFGPLPFSSRQVIAAFDDHVDRVESYPPGFSQRLNVADSARMLGYAYRRTLNRWFGDLKLVKDGTTEGSNRWRVVRRPRKIRVQAKRSVSLA